MVSKPKRSFLWPKGRESDKDSPVDTYSETRIAHCIFSFPVAKIEPNGKQQLLAGVSELATVLATRLTWKIYLVLAQLARFSRPICSGWIQGSGGNPSCSLDHADSEISACLVLCYTCLESLLPNRLTPIYSFSISKYVLVLAWFVFFSLDLQ